MEKEEKWTSYLIKFGVLKLKQINEDLLKFRDLEAILSKDWSKSEKITPDKISLN